MNKKRLSVVMAGAMLASSVAPVLAAEVQKSEQSAAELGLLIKKVRETLESKKFANDTAEDVKKNTVDGHNYAGEPVYFIKVNGTVKADNEVNTQEKLQGVLGNLTAGSKVEIFSKGFKTETVDGVEKYYAANSEVPKYDKVAELEGLETAIFDGGVTSTTPSFKTGFTNLLNAGTYVSDGSTGFNYVSGTGYNEVKKVFVLDFKDELNARGIDDIELKVGDEQLNVAKYIALNNAEGEVSALTSAELAKNFKSFAKVDAKNVEIPEEKIEEITITSGGNSYKVSDLYDGLMLTEKGKVLLTEAKAAAVAISEKTTVSSNLDRNLGRIVKVTDLNEHQGTDFSENISAKTLTKNVKTGEYNVKVEIADSFKIKDTNPQPADFNSYYISATDVDELKIVLSWLNAAHAQVDVLAGDNRYETAVEIAKETAKLKALKDTTGNDNAMKNIVLVNGNSLVDGLAAAPLAEHLAGANGNAPILLTESDELPRATRDYLIELADKHANKGITINIVGGKSVVSNSIKSELIKLGFKVERFGGDNREETSMAVADAIVGTRGLKNVFVVGAEGEADAMSIAGYAASQKTPIIVSSYKGLSEDTLDELRGVKTVVLGGEKAVSASDYKELSNYAGVNNVRRISGANRKATNAAIINEFYSAGINGVESVIVAKDDVLIDALTAANLASEQNAPIVLGTKSLSNDQINALELKAKSANNVYQVGYGVDPTNVVKVVAQRLGLAK